jgi:hypothetical protein
VIILLTGIFGNFVAQGGNFSLSEREFPVALPWNMQQMQGK